MLNNNYPQEMVEKIIKEVFILSLQVKGDYPDYPQWFKNVQVPGLFDDIRNIIIAHDNDKILGIVSLKKTQEEKKICTFYVKKSIRGNEIGTLLAEKAVEYLEEEKPLITIPMDKLNGFIKIGKRYNWEISDIKENLYRTGTPEVIVNGEKKIIVNETQDEYLFKKLIKSILLINLKYV